jgi:hypothetical protein
MSPVARGLVAITRDQGVRAVSLVYKNALFTIQHIVNTGYVVLVREGKSIPIQDNLGKYFTFLKAFISLINVVSKISNSRYYTFLGEFRYDFEKKVFRYEPYVELLKKVIIRVDRRAVTIKYGEIVKRFKRSKSGYTPEMMIETINSILTMMESV